METIKEFHSQNEECKGASVVIHYKGVPNIRITNYDNEWYTVSIGKVEHQVTFFIQNRQDLISFRDALDRTFAAILKEEGRRESKGRYLP